MKHFGKVLKGKLNISNRQSFVDALDKLEGKDVEIRIRERSANRSREQNSLYWKWIDIMSKEIGYSKQEMHELIKYKFLKRNTIDDNGSEEVLVKSTTTLTSKEFSRFMNDIYFWSNDTLNINLPSNE